MNQLNKEVNGADPRLHLVLLPDGGRRRQLTATVALTALDEEQQARFEADVQTLLSDLIRKTLQNRRIENVQF